MSDEYNHRSRAKSLRSDPWFRVDPSNSSSNNPRNLKVAPQMLSFKVSRQLTASAESYDRAQAYTITSERIAEKSKIYLVKRTRES
jgi:hypothetical protein